jgi:hypothetical protein
LNWWMLDGRGAEASGAGWYSYLAAIKCEESDGRDGMRCWSKKVGFGRSEDI